MILENEYIIKLSEIGKGNKVTNKAILSYLEDIGGIHSNKAGYGVFEIAETHLSWILLGWRMQVIRRPKYAEKIKVKTWSKGVVKLYTYREFEVYDEQENLIIKASSKWVFLDIQKGKIVRIDSSIMDKYEPEVDREVFGKEEFDKVKEPNDYQYETQYTVRRSDIDVNNHMHNLNYIELANEALPEDVYKGALFNDVRIAYKKEIKLGETVKCKYTFEDNKHIVVVKSEDDTVTHAIIELS